MHYFNAAAPGAFAPTYTSTSPLEAHAWVPDPAAGVGYTFLNAGAPNIVGSTTTGLRVSVNGRFAVEDSPVTRRQAKHFFATAATVAQWNRTLARQGSIFQFFTDPAHTVTFTLPGAGAPTVLQRAHPANLSAPVQRIGNEVTTTENCNGTVLEVIGSGLQPTPRLGAAVFLGTTPAQQQTFFEYHVANHLSGGVAAADIPAAPAALAAAQDAIALNWGQDLAALLAHAVPPHNAALAGNAMTLGVNTFARPTAVGQALYTGSLGARHAAAGGPQVQDHANGRLLTDPVDLNRVLWGFHWAGVIGMDGTDYLTLENYARNGENAFGQGAELFYFNMYGTGVDESWHEVWATPNVLSKGFANAISLVVEAANPPGLRYFVLGSKNNHGDLAVAAHDQHVQQALCQGLNYANVHRYADALPDQFADRGRRNAWINAINALLAAPPAWLTPTTTAFAQHVLNALNHVTVPPL
ncbi:hypothetical protein J8N05_41755 [Streptomyces sp. BH-SS-21]|uniref:Uncharacterized protein n=1 Tax=Streptomyces liliiviolaceus TaxID=2823109 RepID=A0A940XZM0_9ACTN|nr:hypothetical protein [Streptomyces liliiviolaceus]MBQ0854689.1 hypothetical protein [Streptomyces liliiviolaceus]